MNWYDKIMSKIKEKLIEPVSILTGSIFKIKIKAVRGATYNEIKSLTYNQVKEYTYGQLKGD